MEMLVGGGVLWLIYCFQMLRFEKWIRIVVRDIEYFGLDHEMFVSCYYGTGM
jgi:hypothetical protein